VYALSALLELSQRSTGDLVSCSILSSEKHIPKRFLLQILRRLVSAGILRSARGKEGGYGLGRSPEYITLRDIVDAIEKPFTEPRFLFQHFSPGTSEQLLNTIRRSRLVQDNELRHLTLAELSHIESTQKATVVEATKSS
jgi:Rrf2 family protein